MQSQGCTGKWLKDRERAEETSGEGQAAGHGLCLTHVECPGLALAAPWCWCLLQGILSCCSQEGSGELRWGKSRKALALQSH